MKLFILLAIFAGLLSLASCGKAEVTRYKVYNITDGTVEIRYDSTGYKLYDEFTLRGVRYMVLDTY